MGYDRIFMLLAKRINLFTESGSQQLTAVELRS